MRAANVRSENGPAKFSAGGAGSASPRSQFSGATPRVRASTPAPVGVEAAVPCACAPVARGAAPGPACFSPPPGRPGRASSS